jgi:hypothetical protein
VESCPAMAAVTGIAHPLSQQETSTQKAHLLACDATKERCDRRKDACRCCAVKQSGRAHALGVEVGGQPQCGRWEGTGQEGWSGGTVWLRNWVVAADTLHISWAVACDGEHGSSGVPKTWNAPEFHKHHNKTDNAAQERRIN